MATLYYHTFVYQIWTIMMLWQIKQFRELTINELFELLKLRVDVFVVEQNCAYPELDEKDRHIDSRHLMGFKDNKLVAYARLLAPGVSYPSASIGRVATEEGHRGFGMGRALMRQAITQCETIWPDSAIEIGAQEYLKAFYTGLGFTATSTMYLEDDIPHIDMKRSHVK